MKPPPAPRTTSIAPAPVGRSVTAAPAHVNPGQVDIRPGTSRTIGWVRVTSCGRSVRRSAENIMYEKYFQLLERPFALSPDPEYLYPSRGHQEALSYLRYGVEGHAGFVVITGEIGSGKTTMLQALLGRLDRNITVARLVNTMLDPRELLEAIVLDFGIDPTGLSKPVLLQRLAAFLVQQRQAGRLTLLVIDEAQNLSLPALEEIRMLSNLETEKSKLIQIILIGQPELREKLTLPQLSQLRQRITVSYHLKPLDALETKHYIDHRLKRAAIGSPVTFPHEVTDLIHRRSRGVPRIINVIADATLLFAYGIDRRDIDISTTLRRWPNSTPPVCSRRTNRKASRPHTPRRYRWPKPRKPCEWPTRCADANRSW